MKLKKLLAAALACGSIFACGCNNNYCEADALSDFKSAYLASPTDNRILMNGFNLFGPYFHTDIDGKCQLLSDGTLSWEGKLNWIFTDKKTMQSSNENIPMYIEQRNGVMTVYAYRNSVWNKFNLPGIPAGIAKALKSTDAATLQANLGAVKSVKELSESQDTKTVQVTLDGKKIANLINGYTQGVSGEQAIVMNRLQTAFNNTDLVVGWNYKKATNETVTINANLAPVIRAYAKGVIDEMAAGKITLNDQEKDFYAAMGYYAECPFYLSIEGNGQQKPIELPKNFGAAINNPAVFDDVIKDIATTPTK